MQVAPSTDPTVRRFIRETGHLWPCVAPLMARYQEAESDPDDGFAKVSAALRRTFANPAATGLANDLVALLPGWKYFSASQRCVLRTAVAFLGRKDDATSPASPDPLETATPAKHHSCGPAEVTPNGSTEHEDQADEDIVVAAAVRALLRR